MKWLEWIAFILLILIIIGVFTWLDLRNNSNKDEVFKQEVDAKEMVIRNRDKEIQLLRDSIKRTDSVNAAYHDETVKQKARAESYRTKYEGLRALRDSRNADTLKAVLIICDSTVLNQDTTINRLSVENDALREANKNKMVLADTLSKQVADLKEETQMFKEENKKAKKKESWRKVLRTARDIGIGVISFLIGKGA
jgi:hypothetical protein